jgi:hypothetical protein
VILKSRIVELVLLVQIKGIQKIIKPKKTAIKSFSFFAYNNLITLTTLKRPRKAPNKKMDNIATSKSLNAINMDEYEPSKRRIKLPEIPGTTKAVIAMKPEKNKYHRLMSDISLVGIR